jgi:hypothetical protein
LQVRHQRVSLACKFRIRYPDAPRSVETWRRIHGTRLGRSLDGALEEMV